jgi:hypothetical protein
VEENGFIFTLFGSNNSFWFVDGFGNGLGPVFGIRQVPGSPEPAGGFEWITGEPVTYTNWTPGHPDNCCGGEDVGRFFKPGNVGGAQWTDVLAGHGGNVKGYIFESCNSVTDTDGDGLYDCWEEPAIPSVPSLNGVPIGGGSDDVAHRYRLLGSDPMQKDIFVEVDALGGLEPMGTVLGAVVGKFAEHGIRLHATKDETDGLATDWALWDSLDAYRNTGGPQGTGHFGTVIERTAGNWNNVRQAKALAYRYCVFAHSIGGTPGASSTTSGMSLIPGRDFVVSLGNWGSRTPDEEAGTFMHELGHSLGLRHGGGDGLVGKPNYYSVMNYVWQTRVRLTDGCGGGSLEQLLQYYDSWTLDYSSGNLPPLDENNLSEPAGIGGDPNKVVPIGPPVSTSPLSLLVPMGGAVNWDRVGTATATGVAADANYVEDCSHFTNPSLGDFLFDHDDWGNLIYAVPPAATEAQSVLALENELTLETLEGLSALQLDCNLNGLPDAEDIATGRLRDDDANGVPDACENFRVVGVESSPARGSLSLRIDGSPVTSGAPLSIRFEVPADGRARLQVFNISGALVASLLDARIARGPHTATWSGLAARGRRAAGGVYFLRLEFGGSSKVVRVAVIP